MGRGDLTDAEWDQLRPLRAVSTRYDKRCHIYLGTTTCRSMGCEPPFFSFEERLPL